MEDNQVFATILLLEDEPAHALFVKRILRKLGKNILHYESLSGIARSFEEVPDVVVTDLHVPDAAGSAVVKELTERFPAAPIIVLTSSTSLKEAVEAMKLGARDYIVKNFDESFEEILRLALSRVKTSLLLEAEQAALRRQMEALRAAIENSIDGLAVTDAEGNIAYSNASYRSFVRACGGEPSPIWVTPSETKVEQSGKVSADLKQKFETLPAGAVWHTEIKFQDDKLLAYDLALSAMREGAAEKGSECVVWVRNITEQKRREKFQREILSTTTHDLKNPLSTIKLSAELLTDLAKDNRRASEVALRVAASADSAINLIDEFLSARRIEEGTFILKPQRLNLVPLAEEVLEGFQSIAAARGLELGLAPCAGLIESSVDRLGFQRVLSNLVNNALKFTPKGGRVQVRLRHEAGEAVLVVADTGRGMEPAEVQKIFERFSRLERHADVAGSGLGLFVVKSIVTAHGGKVEVTSQLDKGTVFEVSWPPSPPVNERGELISLDYS